MKKRMTEERAQKVRDHLLEGVEAFLKDLKTYSGPQELAMIYSDSITVPLFGLVCAMTYAKECGEAQQRLTALFQRKFKNLENVVVMTRGTTTCH